MCRFIGEILRGATPFRPRFGKASSSRRGESALVVGRATDRCFQDAVESGRVPVRTEKTAFAVNALAALRGTGIRPVRTQFAVSYGTVGTRLDGIGVCIRHGQPYIVVIELKTTGRDPADNRAYDCPCSLLPELHLLGLPNTERTAHNIQARADVVPPWRGHNLTPPAHRPNLAGLRLCTATRRCPHGRL